VTGKCEQGSDGNRLPVGFLPVPANAELVKIDALNSVNVGTLKNDVVSYKNGLFQSSFRPVTDALIDFVGSARADGFYHALPDAIAMLGR
jgi:hypothetical protein